MASSARRGKGKQPQSIILTDEDVTEMLLDAGLEAKSENKTLLLKVSNRPYAAHFKPTLEEMQKAGILTQENYWLVFRAPNAVQHFKSMMLKLQKAKLGDKENYDRLLKCYRDLPNGSRIELLDDVISTLVIDGLEEKEQPKQKAYNFLLDNPVVLAAMNDSGLLSRSWYGWFFEIMQDMSRAGILTANNILLLIDQRKEFPGRGYGPYLLHVTSLLRSKGLLTQAIYDLLIAKKIMNRAFAFYQALEDLANAGIFTRPNVLSLCNQAEFYVHKMLLRFAELDLLTQGRFDTLMGYAPHTEKIADELFELYEKGELTKERAQSYMEVTLPAKYGSSEHSKAAGDASNHQLSQQASTTQPTSFGLTTLFEEKGSGGGHKLFDARTNDQPKGNTTSLQPVKGPGA